MSHTPASALFSKMFMKSGNHYFAFFTYLNENYCLQVILSFTAEMYTFATQGLDVGTCAPRRL